MSSQHLRVMKEDPLVVCRRSDMESEGIVGTWDHINLNLMGRQWPRRSHEIPLAQLIPNPELGTQSNRSKWDPASAEEVESIAETLDDDGGNVVVSSFSSFFFFLKYHLWVRWFDYLGGTASGTSTTVDLPGKKTLTHVSTSIFP